MSKILFKEFSGVPAKQWRQKIQFDLKGEDYNEKLIYKSLDGINVKPFYNAEDISESSTIHPPKNWNICEKIYVASTKKSNTTALQSLQKGAESLWFVIPSEVISLEQLFRNLDLKNTPIFLAFEFLSETFFESLKNFLSDKEHQIFLQIDIIGNLARSGNWFHNLNRDHAVMDKILQQRGIFSSVLSVDTSLYQNSGANIPQQLAYALAHANEFLNHFNIPFPGKEEKSLKLQFLTATGYNYFFEIAKLRALRMLFSSLASEYHLPETCYILAQPTKRNKTIYDYNMNLLRTTTESMSAVLGGANAVYNSPYDAVFHKNNKFGNRIARNQLLILKNESYLGKVANPAEGSYYIENLTVQFAEKALKIFKEIEKGGGFLKQLKDGIIQRKIAESAAKEQEQFDQGELILTGTNKHQNLQDKMKDELQLYPFLKKNPRKTLIKPILERRLSEKTEQERLNNE